MKYFNSFLQLIDLLSECCLGRNSVAQDIVRTRWFRPTLIEEIAVSENYSYPYNMRSRCLKLIRTMELDRSMLPIKVPC